MKHNYSRFVLFFAACLYSQVLYAQTASLFYFQIVHGKCQWLTRNVAAGSATITRETTACPTEVVWDVARQRILYLIEPTIFEATINDKSPSQSVGVVPTNAKGAVITVTPKGAIRAAYLLAVPETNVSTVKRKDSTISTFKYQEKSYSAQGLPEWGEPYMAVVQEHIGAKVVLIAIKPTKWGAGETPGLGEVSDALNADSKSVSLSTIQRSYTKVGTSDFFDTQTWTKAQQTNAEKILNISATADSEDGGGFGFGFGFVPVAGKDSGVLLKSDFGDTAHYVAPAFYCWERCKKHVPIPIAFQQVGIKAMGQFVLLGEEYSQDRAIVWDASKGRVFLDLKSAKSVIWMPAFK